MDFIASLARDLHIVPNNFLVMGALFLVTFWLMNALCLKKLSHSLVERDHRIAGRAKETSDLNDELHTIQKDLAEKMRRARAEVGERFQALKNKAVLEQRNILTDSRNSAAAEIQRTRAEITEQTRAEMRKLESEIPVLAELIVEKILHESSGPFSANSSDKLEATTGA